ncbi:hypothetical protein BH10BAC5_BH10BAC5_21290 [soil metagenome]
MPQFRLQLLEIEGVIDIFMLSEDNNCYFEDFCIKITEESNFSNEIPRAYRYLEDHANLKSLNHTQFKDITPKKESVKEYEIKTKNLRIYLIKYPKNGKCIIIGGKKNSQKKDISHFRSIKKRFLESL